MNTLAELLSSRVKAEIFRLLFGVAPRELHVREIERQSGLADATARQELRRLSRLGVVESRRDGNRTYYRANLRRPLYPDIRSLTLKTNGLAGVLREALVHPGIRLAFVFGSVAAGAEKVESDQEFEFGRALGIHHQQQARASLRIGKRQGGSLLPGLAHKHALRDARANRRCSSRNGVRRATKLSTT